MLIQRHFSEHHLILNTEQEERNTKMHRVSKTIPLFKNKQSSSELQSPSSCKILIHNVYIKKLLKRINLKRKQKVLTEYHYNLINDKSSEIKQTQCNNFQIKFQWEHPFARICEMKINQFLTKLQDMLIHVPLIYPDTKLKIVIDIIGIASRLYFLYLIPIDLAWSQEQFLFSKYYISTTIFLMCLIVDFILGLITAQYKQGILIIDRVSIIKQQITKSYGFEWISLLILLIFYLCAQTLEIKIDINQKKYQISLLLFLAHQINVNKTFIQYQIALLLSKYTQSLLDLIKLILLFFYVIHLFSCLWFWVGMYSHDQQQENWLQNLNELEWHYQYLNSFYYACVTSFTVGYGDITPKSHSEKLVSVLFIMVSSIQLPYSVNMMGNIVEQMSSKSKEKQSKLRTINNYMQRKQIPFTLQLEMREYLLNYWQLENEEESNEEKQIISQLSEKLRNTLLCTAHYNILNQSSFFKNHFSNDFKSQILKTVKQQVVQPENVIDFSDSDQGIIFLEEGELQVYIDEGTNIKLRQIFKGDTLGVQSFLTGIKPIEKYKSVGFTKILILLRSDFLNTLKEFPQDYETYCKLRDDVIFNQDNNDLGVACFSCNSRNHKLLLCPLLHFVADKELIIKQHNFDTGQLRNKFKRRMMKRKKIYQHNLRKEFQQRFQIQDNSQRRKTINTQKSEQIYQKDDNNQLNHYKFKKIVQKVIVLNNIMKNHETMNNQIDYFKYIGQLQIKYDQLCQQKQFKNNNDDIQNLEYLIMKIKNQRKYMRTNLIQFEQKKDYQIYNPKYNLIKIIKKVNSKIYTVSQQILLQRFLPYLKYPGTFLNQFKLCKIYQRQNIQIE